MSDTITMTEKQYLFVQDLTRLRIAEKILREVEAVDVGYIVLLIADNVSAHYRALDLEESK